MKSKKVWVIASLILIVLVGGLLFFSESFSGENLQGRLDNKRISLSRTAKPIKLDDEKSSLVRDNFSVPDTRDFRDVFKPTLRQNVVDIGTDQVEDEADEVVDGVVVSLASSFPKEGEQVLEMGNSRFPVSVNGGWFGFDGFTAMPRFDRVNGYFEVEGLRFTVTAPADRDVTIDELIINDYSDVSSKVVYNPGYSGRIINLTTNQVVGQASSYFLPRTPEGDLPWGFYEYREEGRSGAVKQELRENIVVPAGSSYTFSFRYFPYVFTTENRIPSLVMTKLKSISFTDDTLDLVDPSNVYAERQLEFVWE